MALSIYCPHCHEKTALSHGMVPRHGIAAQCPDNHGNVWWIGICNGCGGACMVGHNGGIIYPNPLPSPTDKNIPDELRKDLDEAKICMSANCYRACAVMARRCIQQACIKKGCKKENLVGQIAELTSAGHITKEIEEWATVVRWIGNDAAHPNGQDVVKEDAADCLELAEQFLYVLFVTPALAKARRAQRGK
jgi:hypothetical protein